MTQHQQQQLSRAAGSASPPGLPMASDSSSSSIAAGTPLLGLAGIAGLMQGSTVQEEVRVRMTHAARQLAQLADQLVSTCWLAGGWGKQAGLLGWVGQTCSLHMRMNAPSTWLASACLLQIVTADGSCLAVLCACLSNV